MIPYQISALAKSLCEQSGARLPFHEQGEANQRRYIREAEALSRKLEKHGVILVCQEEDL